MKAARSARHLDEMAADADDNEALLPLLLRRLLRFTLWAFSLHSPSTVIPVAHNPSTSSSIFFRSRCGRHHLTHIPADISTFREFPKRGNDRENFATGTIRVTGPERSWTQPLRADRCKS